MLILKLKVFDSNRRKFCRVCVRGLYKLNVSNWQYGKGSSYLLCPQLAGAVSRLIETRVPAPNNTTQQ